MAVRSYFDLDDVLCAEQRVPITLTTPVFRLGKEMDVRNADGERCDDAPAGAKLVVPLWGAAPFRRGGFAVVQSPAVFNMSTFKEFKPDAMVPQLHAKSPYFYEMGLAISGMLPPNEGLRLRQQLLRLFQSRYYGVVSASGRQGFDLADTRQSLCESEKTLLDAVRGASALTTSFQSGGNTSGLR